MMRTRNRLYHTYLLNDMEGRSARARRPHHTGGTRDRSRSTRSVKDYDDWFISPRYGFRGAEDYYELCSPLTFMPEIPCAHDGHRVV